MLTLAEAARFLRVPQKKVKELAASGKIPARQIDQTWHFLKSAWKTGCATRNPSTGKTAMLAAAGAFADDETLMPMLEGNL